MTPTITDVEGDFNPQSTMAMKARILSKGMSKLTIPIANTKSAFLVLNQLKTNIPQGPNARIVAMTTPFITPGGKAIISTGPLFLGRCIRIVVLGDGGVNP